jgi:putative flippase GtrA
VNLLIFVLLINWVGISFRIAAPIAFIVAAAVNYLLSVLFVFRHKAKWRNALEISVYCIVVLGGAAFDLFVTNLFVNLGNSPAIAKITATALVLVFNFLGRRYLVFHLAGRGQWGERKHEEWNQVPRSEAWPVTHCA